MKASVREKKGARPSGQKGWYQHLADCIASEQCPYCGEDIFVNEEISDKTLQKSFFFECSACPWRNL